MYQRIVYSTGGTIIRTVRDGEVLSIPEHEANSDYCAFLEWVAEGNEPETIEV